MSRTYQLKQLSSEWGAVYKRTLHSAHTQCDVLWLSCSLLHHHCRCLASIQGFQLIGENDTQLHPMATARRLSLMFVVAVLVASICFAAVAQGAVSGRTLRATKLQERPGTAPSFFIPLGQGTLLTVDCRLESSAVVGDNWWLMGFLVGGGQRGYVADFDMVCDGDTPAGHCDTVPYCVG